MSQETHAGVESVEGTTIINSLNEIYGTQVDRGETPFVGMWAEAHARTEKARELINAHIQGYNGN